MIKFLSENLKLILTGMVSILMILAAAVVVSLYFGGDTTRQLIVTDIQGDVYIVRDGKRLNITKNSRLKSGDVLNTGENGKVRLSMDGDKHIFAEPNTSVYIYFTEVSSKGDISVNLSRGAVICEINEQLKKNSSFVLKTPNSTSSVRGTVFRASFDLKDNFKGHSGVMVTEIQNFNGSVDLQLYDSGGDAAELPMRLVERTSAQLITAEDICEYGYLNYDIKLLSLKEDTLYEIVRAQSEKDIAFSRDEINLAYRSVIEENRRLATETTVSEETSDDTAPAETVTTLPTTTQTAPAETTVPEDTTYGTLRSTKRTYEYTTYSGIQWWHITGNTNTGTDDYEDWFTEEDENETVTTVP